MKSELIKMGMDELKLKNIVFFYVMGKLWSTLQYSRWR